MDRLKWLKLINFEAHKNTKICFSKRKTVIVGDNDTGKTSIFVAWIWLNTNRPRGKTFIREGAKFCKVVAGYDSFIIERELSSKVNCYRIIKKDKIQEFNVIKDSVPLEIQELLKFDENSFQSQSEAAFFILKPAGQIAQLINKVTGIENIQKVIVEINRRIRENKVTCKDITFEITEIEKDLKEKKFKKLDRYEWNLINRRNIIERIKKNEEEVEKLKNWCIEYNDVKFHLSNLKKYNINLNIFDTVSKIIHKIKKEQNYLEKLDAIIDRIKRTSKTREGVMLPTEKDEKLFTSLPDVVKDYHTLSAKILNICEVQKDKQNILDSIKESKKELKELSKNLTQCPLCNSVIDSKSFIVGG
jgi:exonuclease SbcC